MRMPRMAIRVLQGVGAAAAGERPGLGREAASGPQANHDQIKEMRDTEKAAV